MSLVEFKIERDEESNVFVASWDDPDGGGITTQAETLPELYSAIQEAVRCHFAAPPDPREVALHFENDPGLHIV